MNRAVLAACDRRTIHALTDVPNEAMAGDSVTRSSNSTVRTTVIGRNGVFLVNFETDAGGFALGDLDTLIYAITIAKEQLTGLQKCNDPVEASDSLDAAVWVFSPG